MEKAFLKTHDEFKSALPHTESLALKQINKQMYLSCIFGLPVE